MCGCASDKKVVFQPSIRLTWSLAAVATVVLLFLYEGFDVLAQPMEQRQYRFSEYLAWTVATHQG